MSQANIYIVEDEFIIATDLKVKLQNLGYRVCGTAMSGEQAITEVARLQPDLVLMDIILNGKLDGIQAAAQIRAQDDIPMVYVTAFADDLTLQRAQITDPYGYVTKPFETRELHIAIEIALYKHRAEKKLRWDEALLRSVAETTPLGHYLFDPRTDKILYANHRFFELWRIPHLETAVRRGEIGHRDILAALQLSNANAFVPAVSNALREDEIDLPDRRVLRQIATHIHDVRGAFFLFEDITARKRAEGRSRRREAILDAVSFCADQFLKQPNWETTVPAALEKLGTATHVSRAYIFENQTRHPDGLYLRQLYEWVAPGITRQSQLNEPFSYRSVDLERWASELRQGNLINSLVAHLPANEQPVLIAQDIRSIIIVPILVAGEWWGFIGFDDCVYDREWIAPEIDALRVAASAFGGAIENQIARDSLRHANKILETRVQERTAQLMRTNNQLEMLSQSAMSFVELAPEQDIYQHIAEQLQTIAGDALIVVSSFDEASNHATVRAFSSNQRDTNAILKLIGRNPVGMSIQVSHALRDQIMSGKMQKLSNAVQEIVPQGIAQSVLGLAAKALSLNDIYVLGMSQAGTLIGTVALAPRNGIAGLPLNVIDTMVHQAAVTLQRRQAQDALRESEARYRELFEHINSGVAVYQAQADGQEFVFKEFNHAGEKIDQIKREDLIGKPLTQVFPGVVDMGLLDVFRRVWTTGQPAHHPISVYQDERLVGWRENYVYKLASGELVAVYDDVTERKLAERAIAHNEQIVRTLLNATGDVMFLTESDGKLVAANQALEKSLGVPIELGKTIFDYMSKEVAALRRAQAEESMRTKKPVHFEDQRQDRWFFNSVYPIADERGAITQLAVVARDLTQRKQMEHALAESEARYRSRSAELEALHRISLRLNEQVDDATLAHFIVEQAVDLLGAPAGGLHLFDAASNELRFVTGVGFAQNYVGRTLKPGEGLAGRAFAQKRALFIEDYSTWEGRAAAYVNDPDMKSLLAIPLQTLRGIIGVLTIKGSTKQPVSGHDLWLVELFGAQAAIALENARLYRTEREQYQKLQDSQAQLVQTEKMSALGRLTASIAHEINNPLQAVQTCLSLVREDLDDDGDPVEMKHDLDIAEMEIERIAKILRRLRDFYRPTHEGTSAIDIVQVLEDVIELMCNQLTGRAIRLERDWATDLPTIQANPDQLKQVMLNLILNAVDAMPGGGTLQLAVALDAPAGETNKPRTMRITVSDTGVGVPADELERIFEPFYTTKATGTGLGLSISYEIVRNHGGDINVISEPDQGTTFVVQLPLTR